MANSFKLHIPLPEGMKKDLNEAVIRDGYGMRGKSRWVMEAINSLLALKSGSNDYIELVIISNQMSGFDKSDVFTFDVAFKKVLDDAVVNIRNRYPYLEGVKSRVVRTAIMQRLIRGKSFIQVA